MGCGCLGQDLRSCRCPRHGREPRVRTIRPRPGGRPGDRGLRGDSDASHRRAEPAVESLARAPRIAGSASVADRRHAGVRALSGHARDGAVGSRRAVPFRPAGGRCPGRAGSASRTRHRHRGGTPDPGLGVPRQADGPPQPEDLRGRGRRKRWGAVRLPGVVEGAAGRRRRSGGGGRPSQAGRASQRGHDRDFIVAFPPDKAGRRRPAPEGDDHPGNAAEGRRRGAVAGCREDGHRP